MPGRVITTLKDNILSARYEFRFNKHWFSSVLLFSNSYVNFIPDLGTSTPEIYSWANYLVFWPRELHGLYSPWGHKE